MLILLSSRHWRWHHRALQIVVVILLHGIPAAICQEVSVGAPTIGRPPSMAAEHQQANTPRTASEIRQASVLTLIVCVESVARSPAIMA